MFAHGEPVVFVSPTVVLNDYSGEVEGEDWDTPVTELSTTCGVEPIASEEPPQDGRQSVIVGYRLYFDHIVEIDPDWRCVVRNSPLRVQGRAADWRSPFTGWAPGSVVEVRWTDG
jgi:hypothetical protein